MRWRLLGMDVCEGPVLEIESAVQRGQRPSQGQRAPPRLAAPPDSAGEDTGLRADASGGSRLAARTRDASATQRERPIVGHLGSTAAAVAAAAAAQGTSACLS